MRTLYDVLEISKNASLEVIKSSYKALCKKYHPDKYSGVDAEERIKEINYAYEVLADTEKRKHYDILLELESSKEKTHSSQKEEYKSNLSKEDKEEPSKNEHVDDNKDCKSETSKSNDKSDKSFVKNYILVLTVIAFIATLLIYIIFCTDDLVYDEVYDDIVEENLGNYYALLDINGDYVDELIIRKNTEKQYSIGSRNNPHPGQIYEIYSNYEDRLVQRVGYYEIPSGCLIYTDDTNELFLYSHGQIEDCKEYGSYYVNEFPRTDKITRINLVMDGLMIDEDEYATMETKDVYDSYDQYENPDKYDLLVFLNKYYYPEEDCVVDFIQI